MIPIIKNRQAIITGVGVVNAISNNFNEFISAMRKGKCGQTLITGLNIEGLRNLTACEAVNFDPAPVYKKRGRLHRKMNRSSELVMSAFDEALTMSGLDPHSVDSEKGAVVFGSTLGGAIAGLHYYRGVLKNKCRPSILQDYSLHAPGYRICIETEFLGPNLVFSSACTSSNQALATALDLIRFGKADVVIAGGYDTLSEVSCSGFSVMRNVSLDLCCPFDVNRQGLVLGEGCAVLIVEASDFSAKRGATALASIKGYGVTSDAFHMTAPDNTALGPAACMQQAISMGGRISDVDFICTHGTGTVHNDKTEAKAIYKVFGDERASQIPCTSIKSMLGHTLGAAGAMNAVASIAGSQSGFIPPTIHFKEPDKQNPLSCSASARNVVPRLALSNSLGFGGANCSVLLELNSSENKK